MIRAGGCLLLALALPAGVGACDGTEVVVFSTAQAGLAGSNVSADAGDLAGAGFGGSLGPPGSGGAGTSGTLGAGGSVDKPCQTTDDCDPAWFCQKQTCSDPAGVCLPRPVSDDPVRAPVCGCDHITYFNDTLRQQYGISAILSDSECKSGAMTCVSNDGCGPNGSCSKKLSNVSDCGMPGMGQCWITPNDCAFTNDQPHWQACPPPPGTPSGPPPRCLTTCEAVQSGLPYLPLSRGFACQ